MIRLLHLEITDTCENCPFYNIDWDNCAKSGIDIGSSRRGPVGQIPDWCPLPKKGVEEE